MPRTHQICRACGGVIGRSHERILRAAFGLELPEDEESTSEEFSDATHFDPDRYSYAGGGEARLERKKGYGMKGGIHRLVELPGMTPEPFTDGGELRLERKKGHGMKGGIYSDGGEASLGQKREVELPGADDPDYQLPVYRGENAKRAKESARGGTSGLREDEEGESDRYAEADGYAGGGMAKLGSGKRFAHLTHQLEGRGNVKDPKALAASIGRAKFGAKKFAALGRHADGGEIERPSFADAMARRLRIHRVMHSR